MLSALPGAFSVPDNCAPAAADVNLKAESETGELGDLFHSELAGQPKIQT